MEDMHTIPELYPACREADLDRDILSGWETQASLALSSPQRLAINLLLAATDEPLTIQQMREKLHGNTESDRLSIIMCIGRLQRFDMISVNPDTLSNDKVVNRTEIQSTNVSRASLPFLGAVAASVVRHGLPIERIVGGAKVAVDQPQQRAFSQPPRFRIVQQAIIHGHVEPPEVTAAYPEIITTTLYRSLTQLVADRVLDRTVRPGRTQKWAQYEITDWIRTPATELMRMVASLTDPAFAADAAAAAQAIVADEVLMDRLLHYRIEPAVSTASDVDASDNQHRAPRWLVRRLAGVELDEDAKQQLRQRIDFLFRSGIVRSEDDDRQQLAFSDLAKLHLNPIEQRALARSSLLERRLAYAHDMSTAEMKRYLGLTDQQSVAAYVSTVLMPRIKKTFF